MSRYLAKFLDEPADGLSYQLEQLEALSGQPALDVRLVTDLEVAARAKIKQLHLDPEDTTGRELYHLLLHETATQADDWFRQTVAQSSPDDNPTVAQTVWAELTKLKTPRTTWALKAGAIKSLLAALPPKQVMKKLHYRSVASMLKYQNASLLWAAARLHESAAWQGLLLKKVAQLKSSDFESRDIELLELNPELELPGVGPVLPVSETGTVLISSNRQLIGGASDYLATLVLSFKAIEELRNQNSYLKLTQVAPAFGQRLVELVNGQPAVLQMNGLELPWRSLHGFFGLATIKNLPSIFEPHLQAADLHWQSLESLLAKKDSGWRWWRTTSYLAFTGSGQLVSLNLADLAIDNANQTPFGSRTRHYAKKALWDEIIRRYLGVPVFKDHLLAALEAQLMRARGASLNDETAEALAPAGAGWEGVL